ncbi:MAG: relaxase domain-containing protein [Microthrixaceae bacterium]|nr:relaxase domain-containing protein [Microthrixaceae bacterium]
MLNIGLLAPGAGEYYIGEVASSAEDYYTGRGESTGRWVGSLAAEIGLRGAVAPEDFRSVLAGRDPNSGEQLVHRKAAGSGGPLSLAADDNLDVLQAAAFLGVSGRYVRRLLEDGQRYAGQVAAQPGTDVAPPKKYLVGERSRVGSAVLPAASGPVPWRISGAELMRFAESRQEKKFRPGYDLTLRPPKSVSVLWALGGPQIAAEVREAHRAGVDAVVAYYEQHAVRARKPKSNRRVETDGIIAAAFDHRTSRAGDPLLHTHVVTANMTRFRDEEGNTVWRSVESSNLFEHAKVAGCLYQAHLRYELTTRLGVMFLPVNNGHAEIEGIPAEVIDLFSKRRNEIEEELAATGRSSARSAQMATLETRKAKDYSVDAETLTARWVEEAASFGFDQAAARGCVGRSRAVAMDPDQEERILALLAGPSGICAQASTFRRSDVVEAISTMVGSSATASEIGDLADRFLTGGAVVAVNVTAESTGRGGRSAQQRWTTVELAQIEGRLLKLSEQTVVSPDQRPIEVAVAEVVASRPELSDEQVAMVVAVCTSDRAVLPVEGRPGAGKTYATEAVVAAHVEFGRPIVGCAVSAAAAAELESQAGFSRSTGEAMTVAKLLYDLDRFGPLAGGTTVIVDEASMIGTRDLYRLAECVAEVDGRVVLIGDPDQHGSVEAGGVFARLCDLEGEGLVRLAENRRQDDHVDRLAIEDYRQGLIAEAIQRLDDADRVVRSATAGESFDAMVADWYAARCVGAADPMIAGPNSTRRALNERARVILKAAGELDGPAVRIAGREFQCGDEVVTRRNDRTLRRPGSRDFVKNGSTGVVVEVHPDNREVTVRFEREGTIRVPRPYIERGRLEHGYARTTYGVQGHTQDVARYHPTDASGFEEGYVAVTRGRRGARLYVVDGTVGADQDTHHTRETERHNLDDITDAFGRRRANTMAADLNPDLESIASLAAARPLHALRARRQMLAARLAEAPADASQVIERANRARDALLVRLRAYEAAGGATAPSGLRRRIEHLDRRIEAAELQNAAREEWMAEHAGLISEHGQLVHAERVVEARVRQRPQAHLPAQMMERFGHEPSLQRERAAWTAAVTAVALHRQRFGVETDVDPEADGPAAFLGERPGDPAAAASWDFAASKLAELDAEPAVDSGVAL